ncbi:von Willebrand factor A domain-containing protein 1 [Paramormyrops kingsleyae]|uniref:von Willebrand factor A domain-containing protein 1 n=1 Tax=Paramormyrops kingsleyae TaxID=1676925 RepID=UPI003B96A8CC
MDRWVALSCLLVGVLTRTTAAQNDPPETVSDCCEGDVIFLLDSSGSVSSFEYHHMLDFLSKLLSPFLLGPEQVRVALVQVGSSPRVEFGLEAHSAQHRLQEALRSTKQLKGNTNTVEALRLVQDRLLVPRKSSGAPRVLVWLTDGVNPGPVEGPMEELRNSNVSVLVVSTGHGGYQLLQKVVTPPLETHLHVVDVEFMELITQDFRNAIIELIRAERLQVRDVSSRTAVLQWRPVLSGGDGRYELHFGQVLTPGAEHEGGPGTGASTGHAGYKRILLPASTSQTTITDLQPNTKYNATLRTHPSLPATRPLSITFTTKPEVLSPTVVMVSERGTRGVRLQWGPQQPESVQLYRVEYGALPRGPVQIVTLDHLQNSTELSGLQPDTEYLITVSAQHSSGQERAMSIKVCTQEELPALSDLQLTTVGSKSVQVRWSGAAEGLRGYWLSWEGEDYSYSGQTSSLHLPASSLSTLLTNLAPASRICVSPVYRTARGEALCCTAQLHSHGN